MTWFRKLRWSFGVLTAVVLFGAVVFYARPVSVFRKYSEVRIRLAGAQSHNVNVAGYRIHYYSMGPEDAPVIVLVHGLGGRAEDWENLAPFLTRAGYRVYLPDLPGYGQSEQPADFSYSIPDEAAVVVGFCDALGLKQVDLGGWSMGGWIVQRIAGEHPERIRKLMLFDSAGMYLKPDWDTSLFTPANAAQLAELDALLMPDPPTLPDFVARDILRTSDRNAWIVRRALDSMLTGRDTTDKLLANFKMPVLIVWGSEDHITPLSEGEMMHRLIPDSHLEVVPGCGHLAPDQCAARMAPSVVNFLRQ